MTVLKLVGFDTDTVRNAHLIASQHHCAGNLDLWIDEAVKGRGDTPRHKVKLLLSRLDSPGVAGNRYRSTSPSYLPLATFLIHLFADNPEGAVTIGGVTRQVCGAAAFYLFLLPKLSRRYPAFYADGPTTPHVPGQPLYEWSGNPVAGGVRPTPQRVTISTDVYVRAPNGADVAVASTLYDGFRIHHYGQKSKLGLLRKIKQGLLHLLIPAEHAQHPLTRAALDARAAMGLTAAVRRTDTAAAGTIKHKWIHFDDSTGHIQFRTRTGYTIDVRFTYP